MHFLSDETEHLTDIHFFNKLTATNFSLNEREEKLQTVVHYVPINRIIYTYVYMQYWTKL
jgi:hypothetical protein